MGMEITAVKICEKNKERSNIFIDGQFACALFHETIVNNNLKPGVQVDTQTLQAIRLEDSEKYAFSVALKYVATKVRSRMEIEKKLYDKGLDEIVVEAAIEKLAEYGYVDDEQYAALLVEEYGNRYGKRVLKQKLKEKGIAEEIVVQTLEAMAGEKTALLDLMKKYAYKTRNDEPQKRRQKVVRALLAKGFEYDDIKRVYNRVIENENGDY
ncbi:MAG: regulatory protein RecX [Christensenellaceae bacterium]|jgi:regulatory protein